MLPGSGSRVRLMAHARVLLSSQMLLKMAELGHVALPRDIHMAWSERLRAECFIQACALLRGLSCLLHTVLVSTDGLLSQRS